MLYFTIFQERDTNLLRAFLFILLLISTLYSAKITEYKVFKKSDSIDLLLILDKKFDGEIYKEFESDKFIKYKITNVNYTHKLQKDVHYQNIKNISITPNDNSIIVAISTKTKLDVSFSRIADSGNGLKFNIKAKTLFEQKSIEAMTKQQESQIDYNRYFTVIGIMAVLLVVLVIVKRKLENVNINIPNKKTKAPKVDIIYQKGIDMKTKVSLIQIGSMQYLIMSSPNSYLLLDKFEANSTQEKKIQKDKFDSILEESEQNIDNIIQKRKQIIQD
jgi:flagellar biogenesis protein FliO